MFNMSEHDEFISNRSANKAFGDVVDARLSRRGLLTGGLATAAVTFLPDGSALAARGRGEGTGQGRGKGRGALLGFQAIGPSTADEVIVPPGYSTQVIIPWGDPLEPGGPAFQPDASNTAAEQAQQFGMGHDGMHYFPIARGPRGSRRGLIVVNHEYTTDQLLFPDGTDDWDAEKTAKSQNAHGVSVAEIALGPTGWRTVRSRYARRVTTRTPIAIAGPAAGDQLLRTDFDGSGRTVLGTVNNCSHGVTPWGTYLTCEENFNGYFWLGDEGQYTPETAPGLTAEQRELLDRYGVTNQGFGYLWATTDERFRADLHPGEPNRFGWVTEIDPFSPGAKPVKRTAMGRFKHESATVTEGKGRKVVVYSGDDQRFEYIYKFVSAANWRSMRARGISPLDEGTLYVARFNPDGSGDWLPLVHGEGPLTAANGFADQGEVLAKTRLAADLLGPTAMDRPEWVAVQPRSGEVYCTLTNNTDRTEADKPNPRAPNPWGHIIRWREAGGDNAATSFEWDIFLLAGPGDGVDGSTIDSEDAFGSPDGLWFDDDGRLWIQTDGSQPIASNDQMLAANPGNEEMKRFLTGVPDCEVTGVVTTPDQRAMFVNIQHPGDSGTPDDPTATSSWPFGGRPRPATVAVFKDDGEIIGT
ncbi:PhoX family phosphatase [soil metagenome]